MTTADNNKEQIIEAYDKLVRERKRLQSRIALAGEEAARAKDQETVARALTYTVESIVKGLAGLQLDFNDKIGSLADTLKAESDKVGELRRSIEVETEHLRDLNNIKLAANAALFREQELSDQAKEAQAWMDDKLKAFEEDVAKQRDAWAKEQAEHEAALAEYRERQEKDRAQEQEDHLYSSERKTRVDADSYTEKKRHLKRELAEERAVREKDWAEREVNLTKAADEFAEHQVKIEAFPGELEAATKKAREDAIKKANNEAKVAAELMEREVAASTQVFELKIESLEKQINEQSVQITSLMEQLKVALERSQSLAVKAIEKTSTVPAVPTT